MPVNQMKYVIAHLAAHMPHGGKGTGLCNTQSQAQHIKAGRTCGRRWAATNPFFTPTQRA